MTPHELKFTLAADGTSSLDYRQLDGQSVVMTYRQPGFDKESAYQALNTVLYENDLALDMGKGTSLSPDKGYTR